MCRWSNFLRCTASRCFASQRPAISVIILSVGCCPTGACGSTFCRRLCRISLCPVAPACRGRRLAVVAARVTAFVVAISASIGATAGPMKSPSWRFHALHHTPEHVYFLISARAHPIDFAFIRLCGLVPIYILGLGAPQGARGPWSQRSSCSGHAVGLLYPFERPVATGPAGMAASDPRFHHWHHTRSAQRDHNYASMLP